MTDRDSAKAEIRDALGPTELLGGLGFLTDRRSFQRQPRGYICRCPSPNHADKTPSCSVQSSGHGVVWKCHACGEGGDAFRFVAHTMGLNTGPDFPKVLIESARLAGLDALAYELESGAQTERPVYVPKSVTPEPEREYPPADLLSSFLAKCQPVTFDAEVSARLESRSIDPELVEASELAYALPRDARLLERCWGYRGVSWVETGHRLILPMRDVLGRIRSVRAWRVTETGDTPKRLPPGGYKASGLVLACPIGAAMLQGTFRGSRVWIAEGEPDALTAATWPLAEPTAVLGIVSGSWTAQLAAKFRPGMRVYVWTDLDKAGDRYASEIKQSLAPRGVFVSRWNGGPRE